MSTPVLRVSGLTTVFPIGGRLAPAVNDVSFEVRAGETLGLVGESGSGKSLTALSILGLPPPPAKIVAGSVQFHGRELLTLPERELRKVRGAGISLVFQEPMTALNPVFTIGDQIGETLRVHGLATRREARSRAVELLRAVKMQDPELCVGQYPHQLSGGMRQRALIAIALACRPAVLIADEPTTALDVTVQAQILDLLREMREAFGLAMLLITHDFGVIAETADRIAVMYAGRIVEQGPVRDVVRSPKHPYTQGLLASIPGRAPGRRLAAIEGVVPSLGELPPGCAFAPRCGHRMSICGTDPPSIALSADQWARCWLYDERRTAAS